MTLRELLWMAEARQRSAWDHTSHILAMLYNIHRNPKSRCLKPAHFHPFAESRKTVVANVKDVGILKTLFVKE